MRNAALARMANQNGRTERDDARKFANQNLQNFRADSDNTEHGYQDPRDGRDRQQGRDDFRGGDFANRNYQATDRTEDRWSPRGIRGLSQAGDEYAERDRNMSGDTDYRRGSGYGYDDGNQQQMNYRGGQSGSQAGNMSHNQGYRGPQSRGGNDGHWGDFDRGGQYARGYGISQNDRNYDTQAPQYGAQDPRSSNVGTSDRNAGSRNFGEQRWSPSQGGNQGGNQGGSQANQSGNGQRGQHAGKGPKGFVRSDERISELVHEALTDHEHIDASNITVNVKDGEVTLTGNVDNRSAKLQAEDLVSTVSGVKEVHNQIRVGSGASGSSTNTSHVEIPNDSGKTKLRS